MQNRSKYLWDVEITQFWFSEKRVFADKFNKP